MWWTSPRGILIFFLHLYSMNRTHKGICSTFPRCHGAVNKNPIIRFPTRYPCMLHTTWISLVPFAGCICTTVRHLWPIPDNVHHALYVGYAIQCTDLAHIKRCSIFPLRFMGAHRNKWSNSIVLVRIKRWEWVSARLGRKNNVLCSHCPSMPPHSRTWTLSRCWSSTSCYPSSFQVCWSKVRSRLHLRRLASMSWVSCSSAKLVVVSGSSGCCTLDVFSKYSSGQKGSFVVATWFLRGNSAR